jgi:hypothetical protein
LSSAILYLAIVAIWACVLVPRWLHRSHETAAEHEFPSGQEAAPDHAEDSAPEEQAGPAEPGALRADAEEFATLREQVVEVTTYVEWEAPARPTGPAKAASHAGPADHDAPAGQDGPADHDDQADHVRTVARAGTSREHRPERPSQARPPGPAPRRAHVVQARRRLLTLLVALAVAAAAVTLAGLIRWWVVIPPAGMLGLYLLLLREVARSDAEQDRRRVGARAALAARERTALAARDRVRQAREALPQPTAEIIDISALAARDRDQPYDQYADAEVRAVGD